VTPEEYKGHLDVLASVFRMVGMLPLNEMQEYLSTAQTLAPIIDPTAYRNGGSIRLDDQQDMLDAAAGVTRALARVARRNGIEYAGG
jgi:hypothetical protein